jgi:hypothetical protein
VYCQLFENPYWYRATTFTERSETLTNKQNHRCIDTNLSKQRLEYWKQQSPFNTHTFFAERLAIDNHRYGLKELASDFDDLSS